MKSYEDELTHLFEEVQKISETLRKLSEAGNVEKTLKGPAWPAVGDTVWYFDEWEGIYSVCLTQSLHDNQYLDNLLGIYRTEEEAIEMRDKVKAFIEKERE